MFKENKFKVLLIDDDQDILDSLHYFFKLEGFQVFQANSSLAGLKLAKKIIPDLIVLDLHLPDLDGFDLLPKIKNEKNLRRTKIIMLTADSTKDNRWESLDIGIDDFLPKPFDVDDLKAKVYYQLTT